MWPTWAKVYAGTIAAPMIAVSLGIAYWIVRSNLGGSLDEAGGTSVIATIAVFGLAFVFTAGLFGMCIQRILADENEALLFAATGHLMMAIPAIVFTIIAFFRNETVFLADVQSLLDDATLSSEVLLIFWMVAHTYIGLFLAMADNTSPPEAS